MPVQSIKQKIQNSAYAVSLTIAMLTTALTYTQQTFAEASQASDKGDKAPQKKQINLKYLRVGIGYSAVDNSTVLGIPLEHFGSKRDNQRLPPTLPSTCFSPPGITMVNGIDSQNNFNRVSKALEFIAIGNFDTKISCSGSEIEVTTFFEASEDEKEWFIVDLSDAGFNGFLERWAEELKSITSKPLEHGGISVLDNKKRLFNIKVIDGKFIAAIDSDTQEDHNNFKKFLAAAGYKTFALNGDNQSKYRVAIEVGSADPDSFFVNMRKSFIEADELHVKELDISLARLGGELKKKYGNGDDWVKKMAKEYGVK